ncbi:MAG: hypothetical protein HYX51_07320 [Chloroflexi bacterium]|nr:hypothetical protein [Chloroflexota bacterium]
MATSDQLTVVGVFPDHKTAEAAVAELRAAGFNPDDIGFAMRDAAMPAHAEQIEKMDTGARAGEGAVTGLVTGGVVGGLAAAAVSLLVPGVGPVIGGGILATVLGGAAAGAAAGGLLGALVGMGVSEEEARYYEGEFQAGRAIVTVKAGERFKEATDILSRHAGAGTETDRDRAYAAHPLSAAIEESAVVSGATAARPAGRTGEAQKRTPMTAGAARSPEDADAPHTTTNAQSWPTRADDPYAGKYVEGEEEIRGTAGTGAPGRAHAGDSRAATDSVDARSPDAARGDGPYVTPDEDLERVGATSGMRGGMRAGAWTEVSAAYRQRWEAGRGGTGARWEDAEPGYRYGYEMAADPRYAGREWSDIEANLGSGFRDWSGRQGYQNDESAWERARINAREAWQSARGQ